MSDEWYYIQQSMKKNGKEKFTLDRIVPTVCVNDEQETDNEVKKTRET